MKDMDIEIVDSPLDFYDNLPIIEQEGEIEEGKDEVVEGQEGQNKKELPLGIDDDFWDIEEAEIEEAETGDTDDEEENLAIYLAKSYIEEGILPEDWEIPEDLTGRDLQKKLYEHVSSSFNKDQYLIEQGYTPEALQVAEYISKGMDYNLANEAYKLEKLSVIDLDAHPEAVEHVLRYGYKSKGLSEEDVEGVIQAKFESGTEFETAQQFINEFKAKNEAIVKSHEDARKAEREKIAQYKDDVVQAAKSIKFGGKNLTKAEQKKVISYAYENTDLIETEENGQKIKKPVTGLQKKMHEIMSKPEEFVKFAYFVNMFGDDFSELKERAKIEAASSSLDIFNKKSSRTVKKQQSKKADADDIFTNTQFFGEVSL